ncbi:MAG: putative porin [Candidatus Eremiobacteraeota bacterium]|nr:putative porin [Candidatus Eremiobacteraeota bacterium]
MKTLVAALTAACALSAAPAVAQTSTPAPVASTKPAVAAPVASAAPSPAPSPSPTPRAWQASGFAATSFNDSSLGPGTAGFSFANGGASRTFDTISRQLMLNAINVQLQKTGTVFGKVELTAGTNANVIASYPYANNPNPLQTAFDVTQLYAGISSGPFALQAGKFATLAGAEVIEDPGNANISRSILFGYAIPFTHTGARLTYTPTSLWTVIAGVNNGWDNLKGPGGPKSAELGLAYNGAVFALTAQSYLGMERYSNATWSATGDSPAGHRALLDVVGTYHATPKLTFVGNFDTGRQTAVPLLNAFGNPVVIPGGLGTATWNGFAGYATYQINSKLSAALRGETFNDRGGFRTGFDQQWSEATFTLAYAPSAPVVFRLEGRSDHSNRLVWADQGFGLHDAMQSVAAQVLVKF